MKKIYLSFFLTILSLSAWSQSGGERRVTVDEVQVTVMDSSELVIQSEFGWNLCAGGILELYTDYDCDHYEWLHNDIELNHNSPQLNATEGGHYQIRISENDSLIYSEVIEVKVHQPTIPTVEYEGNIIQASAAVDYQWYKDDIAIPNATESMLYLLESGNYYVVTTDENGCMATSEIISMTVANLHEVELHGIETYPSPTQDMLYVMPINIENQDFTLSLFSRDGKLIHQQKGRLRDNRQLELNLGDLPRGTYFLRFLGEQVQVMEQVVKL